MKASLALVLIAMGAFICVRSRSLALVLARFYARYPLVRFAGDHQLKNRNWFLVVFGLVLIAIGMLALLQEGFDW